MGGAIDVTSLTNFPDATASTQKTAQQAPVRKGIGDGGLGLIKHFEGVRTEAYQDSVGVWTIGYGSTKGVKPGQRISLEKANSLLEKDIADHAAAVDRLVKVDLNQDQYDALVSFTFNLGEGNLAKSTLLKKLNAGDYKGASKEFIRWNKAGGKVLKGLTRRRMAEAELFSRSGL